MAELVTINRLSENCSNMCEGINTQILEKQQTISAVNDRLLHPGRVEFYEAHKKWDVFKNSPDLFFSLILHADFENAWIKSE